MKITAISDTHNFHEFLNLPGGDLLIHAGDITDHGTQPEVEDFLQWFAQQDYEYKLFIGGNHDFFLDENPVDLLELLPKDVTYLKNKLFQVGGVKIYGSPICPGMEGWAFGKKRGAEMELYWSFIPKEVDILITHSPPANILDKSSEGYSLGCEKLWEKLKTIHPKYHIFGHIHASYGIRAIGGTTFINASILHSTLGPVNEPIHFEY